MLDKKCTLNELFIEQFIDNELDYSESSEIASHIKACDRCKKIFDEIKMIKDVVCEFERSEGLSAIEKEGFCNLMNKIDQSPGIFDILKDLFSSKRFFAVSSALALTSFVFVFIFVLSNTDQQNNYLINEIITAHSNDLPDEFDEKLQANLLIGEKFKIDKDLIKFVRKFSPSVRGRFTSIASNPAAQIRLGEDNKASLFLASKSGNKLKDLFKDSKCIFRNIQSECKAHLRREKGNDMVLWEKPDKDYVLVSNDTNISSNMVKMLAAY